MATQFNFNTSPFTFSNSFAPSNPLLEEVPILGQSNFRTPSFGQDNFSFSQLALPGIIGGGAPAIISSAPRTLAPSVQVVTSAARGIKDAVRLPQLALPGATTTASALSRFGGPGAALLGLVDLGSRAFTGKGIGEIGGELVGNFFFPGAQSLPAFNDEERQLISNFKLPEEFSLPKDSLPKDSLPKENFVNQQPEAAISNLITDNPFNNPRFINEVNPMLRAQDFESFVSQSQIPGQTLSQFMRYEDDPSQRTEQFVDAQGRLRRRLTPDALALQGFAPGSEVLAPEFADFEQASRDRQDRIALRDRLPGETQTQRDTRLANARTEGSDNVPLDVIEAINTPANRRTRKQIKRLSQWEGSEQGKAMGGLAGLIRERNQFEPRIVEIDGQRLIQLSPNYYQPVRPEPKEDESFEPRIREDGGFVYYEIAPNRFERQPSTNFTSQQDLLNKLSELIGIKLNAENISPFTPKQEEDIRRVLEAYPTLTREQAIEEMKKQGKL